MLLRVAALLLIAVALARPTLSEFGSLFDSGAGTAIALILDNSASMGMTARAESGDHQRTRAQGEKRRTRFDVATATALAIVEMLGPGDEVALFTTGGPTDPALGKPDHTHDAVHQLLENARASFQRANLAVKVQQAQNLLADSDAANKEIYVLTDMQELCWEGSGEGGRGKGEGGREDGKPLDIPIILVDCAGAGTAVPNVAVQGVELGDTVPVVGMPASVTVELFNATEVEQQRLVELYVDGVKQQTSPVLAVPPQGRTTHTMPFMCRQGGPLHGEVRLVGSDGSKLDDRRFFVFHVAKRINVAVVKPRRHEIPYLEDTFYIEQALAPAGPGWAIHTNTLLADELSSEPLSGYAVIFCVNLPAVDRDTAERLLAYVSGGGNLVWVCGENVSPDAYNAMDRRLLPAPLAELRTADATDGRDSWHIGFLDKTHPALAGLVEPASLYESVLVYKHMLLSRTEGDGVSVLARLDDGKALLAQRNVGKGKVLMLCTSGHVGWSNLPLRPIFLPLLARLCFEAAGARQQRHMLAAGAPLLLSLEDATRPVGVEVQLPGGETIRRTTQAKQGAKGQVFRYADTHQIGIYELRLLEGAPRRRIGYALNVDPDEASPRRIGREDLRERFGRARLVFVDDPDALAGVIRGLRKGTPLQDWFLIAVLLGLMLETFLSNRLSRKREADQGEQPPPGMRRLAKTGRGAA